jgi:hypothetical protein
MKRSIEQWRGMKPSAVMAGSTAQTMYCLEDAKADIIQLFEENLKAAAEIRAARIEALEECAELAGKQLMTSHRRANMDYGWNGACRAIAAAISALKEKG